MELIANPKDRRRTYQRRKNGLKKKLEEFTTLCDVDACMITYGPYHGDSDSPMDLDTWPSNSDDLVRVINKYKSKEADGKTVKKDNNMADFFENRKRKMENDSVKLQRVAKKAKIQNPMSGNSINHASIDQLVEATVSIDTKLNHARNLIELLKDNQLLMRAGVLEAIGASSVESSQSQHAGNYYFNGNDIFSRNYIQFAANCYTPDSLCFDYDFDFNVQ